MRAARLFLTVLTLLASTAMPSPAQTRAQLMTGTHAYLLAAQNASGTTGNVALTAKDADHTLVTVSVTDATTALWPELRVGSCTSTGGHTFSPLSEAVRGSSTTTIHVGIVKLAGGSFSVRVKDASGPIACANLGHANVVGIRP